MSNTFLVGRGPGRPVVVKEDVTFDALVRSGTMVGAEGINPDGNANGALLTVTVSGAPFGNTADGNAVGALRTVTTSLIAGTATEVVLAPGSTITVTTSLSHVGTVSTLPVDGGAIFEFAGAEPQSTVYQSVDFDSIYGRGDRVANGLLAGSQYGWSVVFSDMNQGFDETFDANGPAVSGTTPGAAFWFATVGGETLDIRGFRLIGKANVNSLENFWTFRGGIAPGIYSPDPYFKDIDAYNPAQTTNTFVTPTYDDNYFFDDYISEPEQYIPWAHYEFVYVTGARPDVRWCNEIWLQIAHSNLDGGDRRPSAAPSKRVTFNYSSHWQWGAGGSLDVPQQSLFDGVWEHTSNKERGAPGNVANVNNPVTTVGAWWEFQFPRPVKPKHLCLVNYNNTKESYVLGVPQHYGLWHWEYSLDSGGSWTPVGDPWSFRANCVYMIAPVAPDFGLPAVGDEGHGATHWRMVLDAGPAMGGGRHHLQILFDLDDVTGLEPPLTVAFTDDIDGVPVTATIGSPGSAYVVALSDNFDDALNFTVQNIPNPVLTVAFTDEGQFDTWSDLYPSMVVQTIVIAKGR